MVGTVLGYWSNGVIVGKDAGSSKMDAVTRGSGDGETWDGVLGILDFGLGRGRNTGQEFV